MIALLDNGQDLDQCASELGCEVGQLLTPLTRYRRRSERFAIDNGGYSKFDAKAFDALLERERDRQNECLFVSVPDVVGSARRTLEVFDRWAPKLSGWSLAFVCQDGQEHFPIPWDSISAVFIGGATAWRCSPHAEQIVKTAKILGKWVHVGRVNDPARYEHFDKMGADSCDGTGIARYTHMREAIKQRKNQGDIFNVIQQSAR